MCVSVSWDVEQLVVVLHFFRLESRWAAQPSSDTTWLPKRGRPTAALCHGAAARERRAEVEKDGREVPSAGA